MSSFLFQEISPRGKRRLEFQQAPLKGQTFYLDLQGYRKVHSLQARLKELGGVGMRDLIRVVYFLDEVPLMLTAFLYYFIIYTLNTSKCSGGLFYNSTLELSRPGSLPLYDYKVAIKL